MHDTLVCISEGKNTKKLLSSLSFAWERKSEASSNISHTSTFCSTDNYDLRHYLSFIADSFKVGLFIEWGECNSFGETLGLWTKWTYWWQDRQWFNLSWIVWKNKKLMKRTAIPIENQNFHHGCCYFLLLLKYFPTKTDILHYSCFSEASTSNFYLATHMQYSVIKLFVIFLQDHHRITPHSWTMTSKQTDCLW